MAGKLQSRAGLDESKRQVLESALAFATNNTLPAPAVGPEGYASEPADLSDESHYPSVETLHFMLNSPRKAAGLCFILDMGSVISPKTSEKQGLDLIEKKVSGATYLHYTVNVNFLAWIYLGATNSEPGTLMHAHLLKRQQRYEKNILIALHRIGVLDPPSISLFQALLSGTMYMLLSGKLEKCWQLSTAACRICMALGGLQLISAPSDKFASEEARYAHTYLLHMYLRLAEIQNEIVHGSRERSNSKDMLSRVQGMQQEMWKIKETIREFRNTQLQSKDSYLRGEWMGVDFAYHSVMTSVVKLHPYLAEDVGLHQQLLEFARTSLSSLNDMLLHAKTLTDIHNFRVSVSWLVLFYPLYPFFVLFTHAVSVSSVQDYQLLANVTNGLREFGGQNSALMGVQKLFEGFMAL
ncbi:C6 transcription factor [Colletotrichum asianum]|uniref:C6 transcription factor n=1 Tax=Colletotrichum asianum TaxID=702518 RepID=A0A8H3WQN7_9PEZI|nr:C6 transcription factor [Colletotrichum asianum]